MKKELRTAEAAYALVFAVCVLIALFLLTSCGTRDGVESETRPAVQGNTVTFPSGSAAAQRLAVERVEPPVERELVLPGRLVWNEDRTVRVFAPFAGRVTRMMARVGDRVEAGQPLAEMVSPDFGQAQADARKAQAVLALATKTLERQKELNAHGVAAAKDLQQAEADYANALAESDRALGRVRAYGHSVGSDQSFELKSPVAGTVVERNLNPGQELRPDQPGAPLFVVTDPTHLWITLDANEADLRGLKPGVLLVIASTQFPEETFAGTLTQLSDFVDPVARTLKLRGDVPNPGRALKAEMFVTARLRLPKSDAPTVSAKSVFLVGSGRYVFVRDTGGFTRRAVRVGPEADGRVPILQGLQAGDEVVVAGNLFLQQMLVASRPTGGDREGTVR